MRTDQLSEVQSGGILTPSSVPLLLSPESNLSEHSFTENLEGLLAYGASFRCCRFKGMTLRDCSFVGCTFLGAEFLDCTFDRVSFLHGDLREIKIHGGRLVRSSMALLSAKGVNFSRLAISKSHLLDLELDGAIWDQVKFSESALARLDLTNAILKEPRLRNCRVFDCRFPHSPAVGPRSFVGCHIEASEWIEC